MNKCKKIALTGLLFGLFCLDLNANAYEDLHFQQQRERIMLEDQIARNNLINQTKKDLQIDREIRS